MKRFILIAWAVLVLSVCAHADWQTPVDQLIAQGEFKKAEKVMDKLPKKTRQAEAVRIDSLKTIMQRIRKDFNITPEQGAQMIRERMPEATDAQIANWKQTSKDKFWISLKLNLCFCAHMLGHVAY